MYQHETSIVALLVLCPYLYVFVPISDHYQRPWGSMCSKSFLLVQRVEEQWRRLLLQPKTMSKPLRVWTSFCFNWCYLVFFVIYHVLGIWIESLPELEIVKFSEPCCICSVLLNQWSSDGSFRSRICLKCLRPYWPGIRASLGTAPFDCNKMRLSYYVSYTVSGHIAQSDNETGLGGGV